MAPTAQSYVLLGDAYMAIQEPERALEIYDQALRRNPKDSILRAKMGQVGKTWFFFLKNKILQMLIWS